MIGRRRPDGRAAPVTDGGTAPTRAEPLVGKERGEWRQAVGRLLVVSGVVVYLAAGALCGFIAADVRAVLVLAACYLVASIADIASFAVVPGPSRIRRVVMLGGDLGVTTLGAHLGGEAASPLVAAYVCVVVGHGIGYGERFLLASGLGATVALGWVVAATPYWQAHLLLGAGHLVGVVVVSLLVRSSLRQTRLSEERVVRALGVKTRFATDLSHEFRTALSSISGLASVLTRADLDRASAENVRLINAASETMLSLTDDLLDLACLEAGRFRLAIQPVNVYELLLRVVDTVRPLARQKGLALGVVASMQLEPVVATDGRRVAQVLLNLLGNAVKYTPSGGIRLILEGSRGMLRFEVWDSGPGLPTALRGGRAFRRFIRAAQEERGAGLGLSIAKELVERLGGDIGVCSAPGAGSRFWFTVPGETATEQDALVAHGRVLELGFERTPADRPAYPDGWEVVSVPPRELERTLAQTDPDELLAIVVPRAGQRLAELPAGALADAAREGVPVVLEGAVNALQLDLCMAGIWGWSEDLGSSARALSGLARARGGSWAGMPRAQARVTPDVLVAEDEPVSELFLRTVLEDLGCRVESVADGPSAVEAARARPWDLVLLDHRLPGFGAVSVLEHLRGLPTPVVVVSADATGQAAALQAGAADYIVKPATAPRLASILEEHVWRAGSAVRPPPTVESPTGKTAQARGPGAGRFGGDVGDREAAAGVGRLRISASSIAPTSSGPRASWRGDPPGS